MAKRIHLTKELVDAASAPERGEKWIGDTEIQGFGLRLWATRSGEGKAFAIRVSNIDGKIIRRTFDLRDSWEYRFELFLGRPPAELGSYLATARRWGWNEIARAKGHLSHSEKLKRTRIRAAERTLRSPVQEVAEHLLTAMRRRNLSEPYIDRLDKLFCLHIPAALRHTPLGEVIPIELATALSTADLSPSAMRVLRSFLRHIFEEGALAQHSLLNFIRNLDDDLYHLQGDRYYTRFPELNDLLESDYQQLFYRLESEVNYWQQAMCIRLFFEFWTPFYRLMAARWDGIADRRWYPYPLPEQRLNLRYGGRTDRVAIHLERMQRLGFESFGPENPYWFPSRFGRKFGHIRTVDTVWRNTLHDVGARYILHQHRQL